MTRSLIESADLVKSGHLEIRVHAAGEAAAGVAARNAQLVAAGRQLQTRQNAHAEARDGLVGVGLQVQLDLRRLPVGHLAAHVGGNRRHFDLRVVRAVLLR